ncbi:MAG: PilZ domain-containing protein [Desulfobacterales bacterium]|nr:PilZ domain-containing protein [Desulfobacterales bacterium]
MEEEGSNVCIFTTPLYLKTFELDGVSAKSVALPLQEMVKAYMTDGCPNDICIMPYVEKFKNLLATFRTKNCSGTVIFVTESAIEPNIMYEVHKSGAILIDTRFERSNFIKFLLVFLIEGYKATGAFKANDRFSEDVGIAKAIQNAYSGDEVTPKFQSYAPISADLQKALDDVGDNQPEKISIAELVNQKEFIEADFTMGFEIKSRKEKRKLPLSAMVKLSHVRQETSPTAYFKIYFKEFHPDASYGFMREISRVIYPKELDEALNSSNPSSKFTNIVQVMFKTGKLTRSVNTVPMFEDNRIAFIPLNDAFLQKRRYLRMPPSVDSPLIAFVSSDQHATQAVSIIDISERGLSFWSPNLFQKGTEASVYLNWGNGDVVCRSISRFVMKDTKSDNLKIGLELFPHEKECARIREYVFRAQISIFKALREEREIET